MTEQSLTPVHEMVLLLFSDAIVLYIQLLPLGMQRVNTICTRIILCSNAGLVQSQKGIQLKRLLMTREQMFPKACLYYLQMLLFRITKKLMFFLAADKPPFLYLFGTNPPILS